MQCVDLVIPENNWEQKIVDIAEYNVDIFVMGSDWEGKFNHLKKYCHVMTLERTENISSTQLKRSLSAWNNEMINKMHEGLDAMQQVMSQISNRPTEENSISLKANQKSQEIRNKISSILFPGRGFFSYEEDFNLQIPINDDVSEIELAIEAPNDEILNIGKVDFVGADGSILDKDKIISNAVMSSYYLNETQEKFISRLKSEQQIHSSREARPSMKLTLSKMQYLKSITISNRKDQWRRRSKFLTATIFKGKEKIIEYQNCSQNESMAMLEEICKFSQIEFDNLGSINDNVSILKKATKEAIKNKYLDWDIKKLSQFLPLYASNPNIDKFHIFIMATIILKMLGNRDRFDTRKLMAFSNLLNKHSIIQSVIRKASGLSKYLLETESTIVISKHSLNLSHLRKQREQYLEAIKQAIDIFKNLGGELILCYGTLLGAIRENDFIAHDDDVDLLLMNKASSRNEALAIRNNIIASLRDMGIKVWGYDNDNFHITINNCHLDIFICWREDEAIFLPMEEMKIRQINTNILLPARLIKFRNADYPAPAKPIGFLEERYGEGWNQSNPYHEFPWEVELEQSS